MNEAIKPRYTAGTVSPVGDARHPIPKPEPLLPADIAQISSSIEVTDYTPDGVQEAIGARYWQCVDELAGKGANSITLAGLPIASQLGRARVLSLLEETRRKTGITADAHAEATIAAIKHFGAKRIAVASRWTDALNVKLMDYLQQAGLEILTITSVGQWAKQAFSMSIEEGVRLAFQLGREAMRKAPTAEALLVAGGAWRSMPVVPYFEEEYGIPVVTNPITQAWRLIAAGVAPPVQGWGRLLAGK